MPRKTGGKEQKERKEETIEKRKEFQKKKFLEKLIETPIIQVAAAKTGIDRSTYYRWIKEDPKFRVEAKDALEKGIDFINDMMESILIKNAKDDKLTAVIFWLKNHSPQYNDKRYYEHEHHIRQDEVLTEERKKEIALVMKNWSRPSDEDERDEDYETTSNYLQKKIKETKGKVKKKIKIKKRATNKNIIRNKKATKEVDNTPEVKTGIAKKIVPRKLK
jgi:hypothetical protein